MLEPRWEVHVLIDTAWDDDTVYATTVWPPHYREARIRVNPILVKMRRRWVEALVHEICHIFTANLHDFLMENTGKLTINQAQDEVEESISEIANVLSALIYKVHKHKLDPWL